VSGEDAPDLDLSGQWAGLYNYPIDWPPTSFEVTLRDIGGLITGITTEEGDTPDCYGMILQAVIEGSHDGTAIRFTKMYDYLERAAVVYDGVIQPGGDEIEGMWTVPGAWSGTFLMVRASKTGATVAERVDEKVPL